MLKKIINYILKNKTISKETSIEKIINYKENAWKSSKMANYYAREVEKFIFDSVTAEIYTREIESNSKVLDVGAGTGRLSFAYSAKGCNVTALDVSKQMLLHIENNVKNTNIITKEGSAFNLPFRDELFDAVVSMDVEMHFPNWEKILIEKIRVCRKGGYIIFNSLSSENSNLLLNTEYKSFKKNNFFSRDFAVFLSDKEIHDIAKKYNLTVESITPYNFLSLNSMLGYALNVEEARKFSELYTKAMSNQEFRSVIARFETTIVSKLTSSFSVTKVVRLKK